MTRVAGQLPALFQLRLYIHPYQRAPLQILSGPPLHQLLQLSPPTPYYHLCIGTATPKQKETLF